MPAPTQITKTTPATHFLAAAIEYLNCPATQTGTIALVEFVAADAKQWCIVEVDPGLVHAA